MADIYQKIGDTIVRVVKDPSDDLVDIQEQLKSIWDIVDKGVGIKKARLDTPIAANSNITVPTYIVGANSILVYIDGILCQEGVTYNEVGNDGSTSNKIRVISAVPSTMEATVVVSSLY